MNRDYRPNEFAFDCLFLFYLCFQINKDYVIIMLLQTGKKIIVMITSVWFFLAISWFWGTIFTFEFDSCPFLICVCWSSVVINSDLLNIINQFLRKNCQKNLKLCYIINNTCLKSTLYYASEMRLFWARLMVV